MAIKFLDAIDLTGLEIQNVIAQNNPGNPASSLGEGQFFFDSTAKTLKYWNGSTWVELDGQGGVTGITAAAGLVASSSTGAVTIGPDYSTAKNIILSATNLVGTVVPLEAHVIYSDAKGVVNYAQVKDLPFTANTGTVTGVTGTAPIVSSGGNSPAISINDFTGANGTTAGTKGAVPAPAAADNVKYLKGDGTWATIPAGFAGFDISDGTNPFSVASGNTVSFGSKTLSIDTSTALQVSIELPATGITAGAYTSADITVDDQGRITKVSDGGAGTMSSFTVTSDSGTDQIVTDGQTLSILGGTALSGVVGATDKVTINHDAFGTAGTYAYPSSVTTNATGHITSITAGSAPGTMSSFTIEADTGTAETISNGNSINFAGGVGIVTDVAATDQINIVLDLTELPAKTAKVDPKIDYLVGLFDKGADQNKVIINDLGLSVWGAPTVDLSMASNKITDVTNPTAAQDAATKNYVDTTFAGSGALIYQGGYDASTAAPSTGVKKGWTYAVTKAGSGVPAGFWSPTLEVGDLVIANIDAPTTAADWTEINKNIDVATATVQGIANFPTAGGLSVSAGAVSLPNKVTAGSAGTTSKSASITVDAKGRVTALSDADISIGASQVKNFCAEVEACQTKREYVETVGGSDTFTINHNLNSQNVMVQVYSNASPFDTVHVTVERTDKNNITVRTAKAQAAAALVVMVQKIGS